MRWPLAGLSLVSTCFVVFTQPRPIDLATIPVYAVVLPVMALVVLFIGPIQRRALQKRYLKERANLTNISVRIDQSGVHSKIPGQGFGFAEWPGVRGGWKAGAFSCFAAAC